MLNMKWLCKIITLLENGTEYEESEMDLNANMMKSIYPIVVEDLMTKGYRIIVTQPYTNQTSRMIGTMPPYSITNSRVLMYNPADGCMETHWSADGTAVEELNTGSIVRSISNPNMKGMYTMVVALPKDIFGPVINAISECTGATLSLRRSSHAWMWVVMGCKIDRTVFKYERVQPPIHTMMPTEILRTRNVDGIMESPMCMVRFRIVIRDSTTIMFAIDTVDIIGDPPEYESQYQREQNTVYI